MASGPEDWDWFRVHGRVRPALTPKYRSATWRAACKSLLLVVLVVVGVVLAMPVIYWPAVLLHVSPYQLAPVTLGFLLIGVVLLFVICTAWAGAVREAREEAIREAYGGRVFGTPGGVLAAAGRFGQGRVEAGARGEGSTALLLELLLRIPGGTMYHGLQFPDHQEADVDRNKTSQRPSGQPAFSLLRKAARTLGLLARGGANPPPCHQSVPSRRGRWRQGRRRG